MPVAIPCPHCDRTLRLPDALYHQPAECPRCRGAFYVRWRRLRGDPRGANAAVALLADAADRLPCRYCGELIRAEALKCPACRRWLNSET